MVIDYCYGCQRLSLQCRVNEISCREEVMCEGWHFPVICLSAPLNVISVRGVGVAICLVLCAGRWALSPPGSFLRWAAFFWQLDSLDLDSISLDGRSSGFSRRKRLSSSTGARAAAAEGWHAETSIKIDVNEIRKYGCTLRAEGEEVKGDDPFFPQPSAAMSVSITDIFEAEHQCSFGLCNNCAKYVLRLNFFLSQ